MSEIAEEAGMASTQPILALLPFAMHGNDKQSFYGNKSSKHPEVSGNVIIVEIVSADVSACVRMLGEQIVLCS